MFEIEAILSVRDFIELGGGVLLVIAFVTLVMWTLILERFWYFHWGHRKQVQLALESWTARSDHSSWYAHKIRRLLVSDVHLKLDQGLGLIRAIVVLCPMFGLLGTVTGMIEVFDVMASSGTGNARGMAAGVSKATLPTMAGMVAALSGLIFSVHLDRFAAQETERLSDGLPVAKRGSLAGGIG